MRGILMMLVTIQRAENSHQETLAVKPKDMKLLHIGDSGY